jgi:hypothetical protein
MDLKKDILEPVAKRIKDRAESLRGVKQFARQHPKTKIGIEGWLKVETVAALSEQVKLSRIMNKSMDLVFQGEENLHLELKAATNLAPDWICKDGTLKYKCPCLFLGDGSSAETEITSWKTKYDIEVIGYETFFDPENRWVIKIITPKVK